MFRMLAQLWASLEILFSAFGRIAKAIDTIATVGEEKAQGYLDESRLEQKHALVTLKRELKTIAP